jgi:hypothetical protein
MRTLSNAAIAAIALATGVWMALEPAYAKPEYSKKENKACNFCHPPNDMKSVNDAGKYYKEHGYSLDGYKAKK